MKLFTAIQQPYIKLINLLAPFSEKLSEKLGEKLKDIITEAMLGLIMFLPLYDWTFEYTSLPDLDAVRPVLIFLLFCAVVFFSIKDRVKPVGLNPAAAVIYILFSAAMVISLLFKITDPEFETVTKSLLLLAVMPMLFIVWANRGDYEKLFTMTARTFAVMFVVYCAAITKAGGWMPICGEYRFAGTTTHPNGLAIILATGFACCTYLLAAEKHNILSAVWAAGVLFSGFYLMLTGSRTSLATAFAAGFAALVYALAKRNFRKAGVITIICAALVLSFCAARPFYEYELGKLLSGESEISASEGQETPSVDEVLQQQAESRESRLSLAGKDLNLILNNRPLIWKDYLKNLNLFGRDIDGRFDRMMAQGALPATHAHNYFIQTAFDFGAVTGIFCLLTAAAGLVYCAVCVFRRAEFAGHMVFSILMICAFFVTAIPEIIGRPLGANLSILYALALLPVFDGAVFGKSVKVTPHNSRLTP